MGKFVILILLFSLIRTSEVFAQKESSGREGSVSYITSKNVYVKFNTTEGIQIGDTLYTFSGDNKTAILVVTGLSSISCVCLPIGDFKAVQGGKVFSLNTKENQFNVKTETRNITREEEKLQKTKDTIVKAQTLQPRKQEVKGRISATSYGYFSDSPSDELIRMRYTLSLNARNIGASKFSGESYVTFSHKSGRWDDISNNIFNGLKIYNLAVSYDVSERLKVTAGRKINPLLSNMGAVDGIQAEFKINSLTTGLLIGSRPDYNDYSFNTSLFQYGIYLSHFKLLKEGSVQTSLGFIDQRNTGSIDRRFAYLQHQNSMIKNVFLFGSAEVDLYRIENENSISSPKLSNLYFSARVRLLKNLSASVSYSTRTNIIYYETYKSFLDRLIDNEKQQGYGAQINYRPLRRLTLGINAGYRNKKDDPKPSKNAYFYASYNGLPLINSSLTISSTLLSTSYLTGKSYSASISRDLLKQKIFGTLTYRYQDYKFNHSESQLVQNIAELGLNWNVVKKLNFGLYYEATIEESFTFHRVNIQLIKRFGR